MPSNFPFHYTDDLKTRACALSRDTEPRTAARRLSDSIPREADSTVNFLVDLNAQLQKKISYIIRMEPGIQTPEETLALAAPDRAATRRGC